MCSIAIDELPLMEFVFSNRNSVLGVSGLAFDDVINILGSSSIYTTLVTLELIGGLYFLRKDFGALLVAKYLYLNVQISVETR